MVVFVDYTLLPQDWIVLINAYQGAYTNGCAYPIEKKLSVALLYEQCQRDAGKTCPPLSHVAKKAGVSVGFVSKVVEELNCFGSVVASNPKNKYSGPRGIGSKCLSLEDQQILLELLHRNPFRTRRNYVNRLAEITGTRVSESTISQFFLRGFPIRGSLRKPDMIPKDKFKPENVVQYFEYVDFIATVDPRRLKFGDEKLLKGAKVFCRKGCRNVLTGETPSFMVNGDFCNTYSIISFCRINKKTPPLSFVMHDEKNDATSFSEAITGAIAERFLCQRDILVSKMLQSMTKETTTGLKNGSGTIIVLQLCFYQQDLQSWTQLSWFGAALWWSCVQQPSLMVAPMLVPMRQPRSFVPWVTKASEQPTENVDTSNRE